MEVSLDDYIKSKGIGRPRRGGGERKQQSQGQQKRSPRKAGGAPRGGLRRNTNRGGAPRRFRGAITKRGGGGGRNAFASNFNKVARSGKWQHDLYQSAGVRSGGPATRRNTTRLNIANLEFGVNDSDVKDLFAGFGSLIRSSVHYDKAGKSLGSAEVLFASHSDAMKAKAKYHNVPLDGRPMQITVEGESLKQRLGPKIAAPKAFRKPTRGGAPRGGGRRGAAAAGGQRGGRGAKRGGMRGGRGRGGKPPTQDELDRDLENYMKQT